MERSDNNIITFLERAYDSFVMRDFSYIVGGGILLSTIDYCIDSNFDLLKLFTYNIFGFLILLACCYSIGFMIKAAFEIAIGRETKKDILIGFKVKPIITSKYGISMSKELERASFIQSLSISIVSNSIISLLIVIIKLITQPRESTWFFIGAGYFLLIITSFIVYDVLNFSA